MINLKNYIAVTDTATPVTVITTGDEQTLLITSITINGGETGGEIKVSISNPDAVVPFDMSFTIDTNDVMILDSKFTMIGKSTMTIYSENAGLKVMVSAAEFDN